MKKVVLTIFLTAAMSLHADTIAKITPNQTGAGLGGGGGSFGEAMNFTPAENYILTEVQVPLSLLFGPNAGMTVDILDDSGSNSPGSDVLETWQTGALPVFTGTIPAPRVLDDTISLALDAGTEYWVAVFANNPGTSEDVDYALGGGGDWAYDGSWDPTGGQRLGFEADGTVVVSPTPEPSTLLLAGLTVSLLAGSVSDSPSRAGEEAVTQAGQGYRKSRRPKAYVTRAARC